MKIQLEDGTIENVYSMDKPVAAKIKINNIKDLIEYKDLIPVAAFLDINKRMWDWLEVEGNLVGDPYIYKQLEYAERIINMQRDVIIN